VISEVCREVDNLSDLLPDAILSVLYKETKVGDDVLAMKLDETYRGAGRHLLRSMIEIAIFPRGQVTAEPLGDDALAAELTRLPENDRAIALVMLV
jgi:hypothetical protein